jgi:hypothetical protein
MIKTATGELKSLLGVALRGARLEGEVVLLPSHESQVEDELHDLWFQARAKYAGATLDIKGHLSRIHYVDGYSYMLYGDFSVNDKLIGCISSHRVGSLSSEIDYSCLNEWGGSEKAEHADFLEVIAEAIERKPNLSAIDQTQNAPETGADGPTPALGE